MKWQIIGGIVLGGFGFGIFCFNFFNCGRNSRKTERIVTGVLGLAMLIVAILGIIAFGSDN